MPPILTLTPAERKATLARLAASEVATLTNKRVMGQIGFDTMLAKNRLAEVFPAVAAQGDAAVKTLLDRMLKRLEDAPLTININAGHWFLSDIKSNEFLNTWERVDRNLGGKGAAYDRSRERVEQNLFHYGEPGRLAASVPDAAAGRIKEYGDSAERTFEAPFGGYKAGDKPKLPKCPGMRPRYAALNYANCLRGGAGNQAYGYSQFVLRTYLRFNATYTHCDSFGVAMKVSEVTQQVDELCAFHNLRPLIIYATNGVLEELKKAVDDPMRRPIEVLEGKHYIEAQLHGDVLFDRDIECLRVCLSELEAASRSEAKAKRENLKKFTRRFDIPLETYAH
jgi:hypothetical protein